MRNYVKDLLKFQSCWIGIWLGMMVMGISVTITNGQGETGKPATFISVNADEQPGQSQTLKAILSELEDHYRVEFTFSGDKVNTGQKLVKLGRIKDQKLEQTLFNLLDPLNLQYEQVDERYYVITKKEKPEKNTIQKLENRPPDTNGEQGNLQQNNSNSNFALTSLAKKGIAEIIRKQDLTVSGQVTSEEGEPLPGVNVVIQGTSEGTVTDVNGNYSIAVPENASLVFSFVGYQGETVTVNGRQQIDIEMEPEVREMDEIVIVGYGEQSEITTTGAISSVGADKIEKTSAPTLGEAISGRVPGLSTVQITGQPGMSDPSIYLRGIGTMNQTDPLIIIDGVPNSMRAFMQLNPSDIKNISVLKDASSTAVYGVRGANGAIIVDTKRGQVGKTQIRADVSFGTQIPTNLPNFVNAYKWAKMYNQGLENDGNTSDLIPQSHIRHFREQDLPRLFPDNDWESLLLDNSALQARGNVNISGGTEDVKYFSSLGYLKQDGLFGYENQIGNFTYDRYNLRTNVDLSVTPTTQVDFTSNARIGNRKEPLAGGAFWRQIHIRPPVTSAGIVDGKLITPKQRYQPYITEPENPFDRLLGTGFSENKENRLSLNLNVNQKLKAISPALEGLEFRTKLGYRAGFNEIVNHNGPGHAEYLSLYNIDSPNPNPDLSDSTVVLQKTGEPGTWSWDYGYDANRYIYWEAGLDYNKTFNNNNNIGALLLYTQNKDYYPGGEFSNIPTGNVGMVGRVTYDYKQQYMIEFNMGYNGSENFAQERRFGWFPSVSGGWVMSEENFMQGIQFLDRLKLRFSYGIVGSDQTAGGARFIYLGDEYVRSANQFQGYNFGNTIPEYRQGTYEAGVGNENITWETSRKQNYGIDIKMFDGNLSLTTDYFYEYRDNILMYRQSAPTLIAIDLPPLNMGEMENEGFELQMTWQDQLGDFNYSISGNISRARNKVLYMDEVPPREPYQTMTGHSLNKHFGYVWEGFYTQEEIERVQNGELPQPRATEVQPGDMRYKDLNGDGVIDQADRKPFGDPFEPRITGGLNLDFSLRGFDLGFGFQGAAEVSRSPWNIFRSPFGGSTLSATLETFYNHSWTPERAENGTAKWPRATFQNDSYNHRPSTFWNRNSSYIRLRRAELGYTFDANALKNSGFQQLRIYLRGNNLYTLTKDEYIGIDPERQPHQNMGYPLIKLYAAGLNVTF